MPARNRVATIALKGMAAVVLRRGTQFKLLLIGIQPVEHAVVPGPCGGRDGGGSSRRGEAVSPARPAVPRVCHRRFHLPAPMISDMFPKGSSMTSSPNCPSARSFVVTTLMPLLFMASMAL